MIVGHIRASVLRRWVKAIGFTTLPSRRLVALDAHGFRDGKNDGPFVDETLKGEKDADILWSSI